MPLAVERGASARDPGKPLGSGALQLLRSSHIFASAVREILELKLVREVSPVPLTLSQFHLLKLMFLNGRHQVGEVADFLGVSPPAATKNIDKLEAHGLVVRAPSKGDRRATLLSVSPKGRRLVRRYEALKTARLAPVLARFRPEELEQLKHLLERFSLLLLLEQQEREALQEVLELLQLFGSEPREHRGEARRLQLLVPPHEPAALRADREQRRSAVPLGGSADNQAVRFELVDVLGGCGRADAEEVGHLSHLVPPVQEHQLQQMELGERQRDGTHLADQLQLEDLPDGRGEDVARAEQL